MQIQDEDHLITSSDTGGIIKIWDIRSIRSYDRKTYDPEPQYSIPPPGKSGFYYGYNSLVLNSSKTHLYASCKDNRIYCFDLASYNEKALTSFSGNYLSNDLSMLNGIFFVFLRVLGLKYQKFI